MHSACAAPGDCLQVGPDPPECATVLLDTELGDGAALGDPLLKPPQGYDLLWADDAARPERRLAFWQPVPYEGCAPDPSVCIYGCCGPMTPRARSATWPSGSRCPTKGARQTLRLAYMGAVGR